MMGEEEKCFIFLLSCCGLPHEEGGEAANN